LGSGAVVLKQCAASLKVAGLNADGFIRLT